MILTRLSLPRERPRARFWKRLTLCEAFAFPWGAHGARLQNCSRAGPLAKQMLFHWQQGRGWGGAASFGVTGLWARRLVAADCRHPDLRARRPATPMRPATPKQRPCGSPRTARPTPARLWHVNGFAFGTCEAVLQTRPVRAPSESKCFAQGSAFPKTCEGPLTGP